MEIKKKTANRPSFIKKCRKGAKEGEDKANVPNHLDLDLGLSQPEMIFIFIGYMKNKD